MKRIALILMCVAVALFARSKTTSKMGVGVLVTPELETFYYENVTKHNLVVDDIDSILTDVAGVTADSINKTGAEFEDLTVSDSAVIDSAIISSLFLGGAVVDSADTNASGDSLIFKAGGKYFVIPER